METKIDAAFLKTMVDQILEQPKEIHTINLRLDKKTFTLLYVLSDCTKMDIANVISKSLHVLATLTPEEQESFAKRPLAMGVGQPAELLKAIQELIDEEPPAEQS